MTEQQTPERQTEGKTERELAALRREFPTGWTFSARILSSNSGPGATQFIAKTELGIVPSAKFTAFGPAGISEQIREWERPTGRRLQ